MSSHADNCPIGRGEHSAGLSGFAGIEKSFEDLTGTPKNYRAGYAHRTRCRLVKNSSGIALLPKRLVSFKAGTNRTEVDGYARTDAQNGVVPVDEHLDSNGVPNGEYFWVVMDGPALCTMPASQVGDISEDGVLVALTAAASTVSTTAGRVAGQSLAGATAVLGGQIQGALGRALSAVSSSSTNADILVYMKSRWD